MKPPDGGGAFGCTRGARAPLILSEKAGINIQESAASSKPLEEFIRQFTVGSTGNGEATKKPTSADKPATASR